MQITIYNNQSDARRVSKMLTALKTLQAEFYESSSVIDPVLLAAYDSTLFKANYAYIELMGRYYFIKNIEVLNGRQMRITMHADVLMSYAAAIKNLSVIISKQENDSYNLYLDDGSIITLNKTFNTVIPFTNGFNDQGEYILITAGA